MSSTGRSHQTTDLEGRSPEEKKIINERATKSRQKWQKVGGSRGLQQADERELGIVEQLNKKNPIHIIVYGIASSCYVLPGDNRRSYCHRQASASILTLWQLAVHTILES